MQFIECNPSHQCAELLPHAPSRSEPTREHALINPTAPLHHGAICRQACPWQHLEAVPPLEQAGWHLFLTHRPALLAGERDGEWGMRENWADGEAERRAGRQHQQQGETEQIRYDKQQQQPGGRAGKAACTLLDSSSWPEGGGEREGHPRT